MANVLIISGSYFPYATANAVCVKKFEVVLKSHGHKVIYCNRKHDLYEPDYHIYEGTELYTVGKNSDLFFQTIQKLNGLSLPNNMQGCFALSNRIFRILMKLRNIGKNKSRLRETASDFYINQYAERIASIIEKENIDVIMSVSMPFDSHKAALKAINKLKSEQKKTPKWIAYCIDAYSNNEGTREQEKRIKEIEEVFIFEQCDRVIFLEPLKKDYETDIFNTVKDKFCFLPLPTFEIAFIDNDPALVKQNNEHNAKIKCIYAGTLYDGFRNIDGLIRLMTSLKSDNIEFHFYGKIYPKTQQKLSGVISTSSNNIFIHGLVSYDEILREITHADVFINLANDNETQIPSKIFEGISNKKPMINIYSNPKDIGTQYLLKYPLACNICVRDMHDDTITNVKTWLENSRNLTISNEQLSLIYRDVLSEKVKTSFYDIFEDVIS